MKSVFLPILIAFLALYAIKIYTNRSRIIKSDQLLKSYDYIVVGAGTAGSIVASRLMELENVTVLILEAGHDDLDFPGTQWLSFEQQLQLTNFDWMHETVSQTHCCDAMVGKKSKWPRAKGLGGCSSHYGAVHVRGSRYDYDWWDSKFGTQSGWSFHDVLPYFKKLENAADIPGLNKELHGYDGPIVLTDTGLRPLAKSFVEAAKNLGFPWRRDPNAMGGEEDQEGFSTIHRALYRGRRMSTAEAYLRPASNAHSNRLHILTHAHVKRILIDDTDPELVPIATGVEFVHHDHRFVVNASREVILSAGSVSSPHLLMVSGIGPKDDLQKYNIPIILDNPNVGQNLYDHFFVPITATINTSDASYNGVEPNDTLAFTWAKLQYHLFGKGPLAHSGIEAMSFVRSGVTNETWPDLQLYLMGSAVVQPESTFNLNEKGSKALYATRPEKAGRKRIGFLVILLHPHNPGEIRLQSPDPLIQPSIEPKYLHNDVDVEILAKGVKIILQLMENKEMKKYDTQLASHQHAPGCENLQLWSDEYVKCYVRSMLFTVYHPIGTCKMGKTVHDSVVDKKLRVHGIDQLRIVDASVFPYQVSANTNAPTMMVAEKASDLIKADYLDMDLADEDDLDENEDEQSQGHQEDDQAADDQNSENNSDERIIDL